MKPKKVQYIRRVLQYLQPLSRLPLKERNKIVPLLSDECIHKICESCHNLLLNTYKLNEKRLSKVKSILYRSRKNVRKIANPSSSLLSKRKLLSSNQTGRGFFTILASVIIPALIGLINK